MRRFSFTLIELLVVIAAVSLLIAILLPVLQSSRQQAKAVLCNSNVKQLTLGLFMYETDNRTLPYGFNAECGSNEDPIEPPGGYPGNQTYDRKGWWWLNYTSDYSRAGEGKRQALWCPSRRIKDPEFNYVLHGNYGVNNSICKNAGGGLSQAEFIGVPLRSSDIAGPSRTLLIVDCGYGIIKWWQATAEPPVVLSGTAIENTAYIPGLEINKERVLRSFQREDAIYGRHPKKTVNAGFVDGHASRVKAEDLLVEKIGDDYKNKSPLWVPK
jgi:prepilin-type processing-associated H-X9-DG protein